MSRVLLIMAALLVAVLAGCGEKPADNAGTDSTAVAPGTPDTPDTPETAALSETITLPAGWEINDAITPVEVEAIMGRTGFQPWAETLSDPAAGKPQGSFYDGQLAASTVNFLVYCAEGQSNYDRVLAFVQNPVEVQNEMWDQAVTGEMTDAGATLASILVRRGDVCIRIRYNVEIYPELDRTQTLTALAELLINRLYAQ